MSNTPYMPIFVGDIAIDTHNLSTEEFGAYCLLLFATWANKGQPLPDNDVRLARTCRVTVKRWRERLRPALVGFFDLSAGTWRQGRLEKEWNFVEKQVEQKRNAGKASARAKALKSQNTDQTAVPEPLPTASQQRSNNSHSHPEEDSVGADAPTADAAPEKPADEPTAEPPVPEPARDYVKEAFDMSVELFGPRGRALAGKALKNTKDGFIVLDALYATKRECIGDPIEFFLGAIKWRMGNGRQSAHAAETAAFDEITRYTIQ